MALGSAPGQHIGGLGPVCCVIEDDHRTAVGLVDEGPQVGQCHLPATIAGNTDRKFLRAADRRSDGGAETEANGLQSRAHRDEAGRVWDVEAFANPGDVVAAVQHDLAVCRQYLVQLSRHVPWIEVSVGTVDWFAVEGIRTDEPGQFFAVGGWPGVQRLDGVEQSGQRIGQVCEDGLGGQQGQIPSVAEIDSVNVVRTE